MIVKIDGMTCPTCATAVERQLSKLVEIGEVDISISKGTATVMLKDGKTLAPEIIVDAVAKAGFKAELIKLENGFRKPEDS